MVTMCFVAVAAVGCAGGNAIENAVPQAAFAEPAGTPDSPQGAEITEEASAAVAVEPGLLPPEEETDPVFTGTGQVANTGRYPNLNIEPRAATAQMSDTERDILIQQMSSLNAAHGNGQISEAEYRRRVAELRRLAETHSGETIERIEKPAPTQ